MDVSIGFVCFHDLLFLIDLRVNSQLYRTEVNFVIQCIIVFDFIIQYVMQ